MNARKHVTREKGELYMVEKKKKYLAPIIEFVDFSGDDILTTRVYEDQQDWYNDETDGDEF